MQDFLNSPVFVVVRIRIALPGRRFCIPCVNVGSADGEAWKIPVFQVIHRTEEDRFFAVSVEVGTVIPPDIQAAVGGSVGWSHTLQKVSLLTVSLNPGAFEAQIGTREPPGNQRSTLAARRCRHKDR